VVSNKLLVVIIPKYLKNVCKLSQNCLRQKIAFGIVNKTLGITLSSKSYVQYNTVSLFTAVTYNTSYSSVHALA